MTDHAHYGAFDLSYRLDEAGLDDEENLAEIDHWAARCRKCRGALRTLVGWLEGVGHPDPRVGPEHISRHELYGELTATAKTFERQLGLLLFDDLYQQWGLVTLLIETSREVRLANPERSFELARLGQAAADRLDEGFYRPEWVADLRALAHGELADTPYALGHLEPAGRHLDQAHRLLETGTGSPRIPHRLAQLRVGRLSDQGRATEAVRLLYDTLGEQLRGTWRLPLPWILRRWGWGEAEASEEVVDEILLPRQESGD